MQFTLSLYMNEKNLQTMSKEFMSQVQAECHAYVAQLKEKRQFIAVYALKPAATATTVQPSQDGPIITDGPVSETGQTLACSYIIECKDQDEATEIARHLPDLKFGASVEVRALWEM